jgi:hypothetical protein
LNTFLHGKIPTAAQAANPGMFMYKLFIFILKLL